MQKVKELLIPMVTSLVIGAVTYIGLRIAIMKYAWSNIGCGSGLTGCASVFIFEENSQVPIIDISILLAVLCFFVIYIYLKRKKSR